MDYALPAPVAFNLMDRFDRMDASSRNFALALGLSLLLHGVLLSLHFSFPEAMSRVKDQALDVILVNSKSARKPDKAQARAQAHLDGGGNTAEDRRAKTPLPLSVQQKEGDDLADAQRRITELEAMRQQVLTQAKGTRALANDQNKTESQTENKPVTGFDLRDMALAAIKRLEGEIALTEENINKHPRRKVISVRTEAVPDALYVNAVTEKIERIGTLNYPAEARGKTYGKLLVTLVINADGSLFKFELDRPSEQKLLNAAAERISRLASPFPRIPAEVLSGNQVVSITRWWSFTKEDLQTSAVK